MAIDTTILSTDLSFIIADLPTTVTIDGTDYTCTKRIMSNEQAYTGYGLGNEYEFTIYLNLDDITAPANHTLVTIAGTEYRILDRDIGASKVLTLHMGNKYAKLD